MVRLSEESTSTRMTCRAGGMQAMNVPYQAERARHEQGWQIQARGKRERHRSDGGKGGNNPDANGSE